MRRWQACIKDWVAQQIHAELQVRRRSNAYWLMVGHLRTLAVIVGIKHKTKFTDWPWTKQPHSSTGILITSPCIARVIRTRVRPLTNKTQQAREMKTRIKPRKLLDKQMAETLWCLSIVQLLKLHKQPILATQSAAPNPSRTSLQETSNCHCFPKRYFSSSNFMYTAKPAV